MSTADLNEGEAKLRERVASELEKMASCWDQVGRIVDSPKTAGIQSAFGVASRHARDLRRRVIEGGL